MIDLKAIEYKPNMLFLRWNKVPVVQVPFIPSYCESINLLGKKQTVLLNQEQERYILLSINYYKFRICQYRCFKELNNGHKAAITKFYDKVRKLENDMVNANIGLVIMFSKKFAAQVARQLGRFTNEGDIDSNDLQEFISEGLVILRKAVHAFDTNKTINGRFIKFSTFASHCIINAHKQLLRKIVDQTFKYKQLDTDIQCVNHQSDDVDPRLALEKKEVMDIFSDILRKNEAGLCDKQLTIIKNRWLVPEQERAQLDTIGNMFNLTKERIRQIEVNAMQKLWVTLRERGVNCFSLN